MEEFPSVRVAGPYVTSFSGCAVLRLIGTSGIMALAKPCDRNARKSNGAKSSRRAVIGAYSGKSGSAECERAVAFYAKG